MLRTAFFMCLFWPVTALAQFSGQRVPAPIAPPALTQQGGVRTTALAGLERSRADIQALQQTLRAPGPGLAIRSPCAAGQAQWRVCLQRLRASFADRTIAQTDRDRLGRQMDDVEAEMERVRNSRDTATTNFHAIDAKLDQLLRMLSDVAKTAGETRLNNRDGL